MNKNTIYVRLLDEGVEVFRPVKAEMLSAETYEISASNLYDEEDELWEFLPGTRVRVEPRDFDGRMELIAVSNLDDEASEG